MKRLTAIVLLLVACAAPAEKPAAESDTAPKPQRQPPTLAAGRTILENAPELGEFEFTKDAYSLPMSERAMNEAAKETATNLRRAGWISIDGSGKVVLTRAEDDRRFVVRPNGFVDIVPLAKKEMGEVSAVRLNADGTADVDFTWRWIPNELGELIAPMRATYEGEQRATATLIRAGDSWSVLRITPGP